MKNRPLPGTPPAHPLFFYGEDVSNEACQVLFREAAARLRRRYPRLTVRSLDGIVWRAYQSAK